MMTHPDAYLHRSAARVAAGVKQHTSDSYKLRDPDIETATVDDNGALHPSQSTITIPLGSYYLPPSVAQDKPTLGAGDVVVVIWADQGENRRPYVVLVASDLVPPNETGILNADGSISTSRGYTIPSSQVAITEHIRDRALGVPYGLKVVAVWADKEDSRVAYVVGVV